jgi:hypothetical protein
MSGDLTPGEQVAAGEAFADVRNWAGIAWRTLAAPAPATRSDVLASVDELAKRLEEVRQLLGGADG